MIIVQIFFLSECLRNNVAKSWTKGNIKKWYQHKLEGSHHGVMAKVLDYSLEISEFELQSRYYVHFQTTTFEKAMKTAYPSSYRLNSITGILLQEWVWHLITHEGWYAIKQRNQTKPETIIEKILGLRNSVWLRLSSWLTGSTNYKQV